VSADFASAVTLARGGQSDLVATVKEILTRHWLKLSAQANAREIHDKIGVYP
jgi:hypothetical protein